MEPVVIVPIHSTLLVVRRVALLAAILAFAMYFINGFWFKRLWPQYTSGLKAEGVREIWPMTQTAANLVDLCLYPRADSRVQSICRQDR